MKLSRRLRRFAKTLGDQLSESTLRDRGENDSLLHALELTLDDVQLPEAAGKEWDGVRADRARRRSRPGARR